MKNLISLSILLISFSTFSQVLTEETLDTSIIPNNSIDSIVTSNALKQEKHPDWFDILKTNFGKMEKSGTDTLLLDSAYTYHFYSPDDSVLVLKQYANYYFDENKIMLSRFILDSLTGEWLHINEDAYYYDDWGNDSLLISDIKDTINNTWVHDKKTEYDFDYNGNETYYAFYRWNDSLNLWIGSSKTVRNYDEKNRLLLLEIFSWDNDSNKWDMTLKREYAFDSWGNKILDVSYGRDWQTNKLMPRYKYEYEFDENGNEILNASYNWNKEKEQWWGTSKGESVYDENGNQILSYYYTWDYENEKWKNNQKSENAFNEKRFIISSAVYFWNDELSQWYGHWKVEREFNSHGQDSITIDYEWSFEDTVWYKKSKTEYIYYKPELYPSKIIYKWNREINDWELDKKTELGFDDYDQFNLEANYIWNDSLKVWKGDSKTEIHYNSNGDQTEMIYYDFEEKHLQAVNTMIFSFDSDSLINGISTELCPEQNVVKQDSDYVEGTGSMLWEYQIGELTKWQDGCKIGIKNDKDLSSEEGFYFDYKILDVTSANLAVLFKEKSGELWVHIDDEILTFNSGRWEKSLWFFSDLDLPERYRENGILDLNNIDSVQFIIYDLQEENISGAFLLDNLGTYQVKDTAVWKTTAKTENIYDDHGSLIYSTEYALDFYADTLKITSQSRYDITYDANGNQTSFAQFQWNSYSSTWDGLYKTEKAYDDSGRVISSAGYSWNYEKEVWVGGSKEETSYDSNGNLTSKAYIYWDENSSSWMPSYKTENYYNNNNERTKHVYYKWNELSDEWEIESFFFDTKYNYISDDNNNLILYEYVKWDENLLIWRAIEKYYFYYSTHQINPATIQTNKNEMDDIRVYPNPFNEKLVVETYSNELKLDIFDISGKKIMTRRLDKVRNEINLSELDGGLYIIQVYDEKNVVFNQKIIKH